MPPMYNPLPGLLDWFQLYTLHILLTVAIIVVYFIIRRLVIPRLEDYVERDNLKSSTLRSALFSFTLFSSLVTLMVVLAIWGFNFGELLALSTGILAVTGVALFASWSILSNITSFFLLLANQCYKRGNFIRIVEGDNFVEGYISQINLFNTVLITESRETIVYPNNLITARMTMINPKGRSRSLGKIADLQEKQAATEGAADTPAPAPER